MVLLYTPSPFLLRMKESLLGGEKPAAANAPKGRSHSVPMQRGGTSVSHFAERQVEMPAVPLGRISAS